MVCFEWGCLTCCWFSCFSVLPLMAICLSPPMMITDLAEEGNLRQYLGARGWEQSLGRKLLVDVATGMTYLHSLNILHGDLKSLNVLVDGNRAMITDFGLSKVMWEVGKTNKTTAGGMAGTPGFSAPEVLMGEELKPSADVYAFAMVCYEVVSKGDFPFARAGNIAAVSRLDHGIVSLLMGKLYLTCCSLYRFRSGHLQGRL